MIDLDLFNTVSIVDEPTANALSHAGTGWHTVQIHPPVGSDVPPTLPVFVQSILELQSRYKIFNRSPIAAFELRRHPADTLRLQFAVPTRRLERKIRTHLTETVPDIAFSDGVSGIPIVEGDAVGGALLTLGRRDWYPLQTGFDRPPTNNIVSALHRDAMQDTRFVIQILFRPVAGRPFRRWLHRYRAYKRVGYLRKEKTYVFHEREATPRERQQADRIEEKMGRPQFHVTIRILAAGMPPDLLRTRVKEVAAGFNVYESMDTGQYLDVWTVKSLRNDVGVTFARDVALRQFGQWSSRFHVSTRELAGMVAVPGVNQDNLQRAGP